MDNDEKRGRRIVLTGNQFARSQRDGFRWRYDMLDGFRLQPAKHRDARNHLEVTGRQFRFHSQLSNHSQRSEQTRNQTDRDRAIGIRPMLYWLLPIDDRRHHTEFVRPRNDEAGRCPVIVVSDHLFAEVCCCPVALDRIASCALAFRRNNDEAVHIPQRVRASPHDTTRDTAADLLRPRRLILAAADCLEVDARCLASVNPDENLVRSQISVPDSMGSRWLGGPPVVQPTDFAIIRPSSRRFFANCLTVVRNCFRQGFCLH